MKKTIILLSVTILLITAATGCSGMDSTAVKKAEVVKHSLVDAKTDGYDTVEELESAADLVIKAKRLPKEENVIKKSQDHVVSAYTFSEVEIEEIYKNASSSLSKGDVITILENQAEDEETRTVYHIAGYNMMVEGCEYLLFLREASLSGRKYYCSLAVNCGTISLDDDGRDKVYSETGEEIKSYYKGYEKIWEEARARYATQNANLEGIEPSREDGYSVQWSGWTLEKYMEESSCIFYGKCIGKNVTQHGSSELQFDIQNIYKGVYDPKIKKFHSWLSEPFEEGKEYLIFCGHDASVYSGEDTYGISTFICETEDGLYHEGILGVEKENMQSILKLVSSYMEQHSASNEVKINTDYCRSEKLDEIYEYADTVIIAKITGVFDNTQEDRTAYYFEVKDTLKGRVSGEQWIMAFKDSMKVGEEYLLLLSAPGADAIFFTMCSPQSVLPVSSDKAKTIVSFR